MTRLILARHGETDWNVVRRIQGRQGEGLNANGRTQAAALAAEIAATPIAAIVASPAQRTLETASIVASRVGLPVHPHPGVIERGYGVLEGLLFDDVLALHPDEWARIQAGDAPTGGESRDEAGARMAGALREIAAAHAGAAEPVLVVTHGGVMRYGLEALGHDLAHWAGRVARNCETYRLELA